MSSTTLAIAASPTRVRSRIAWRVLLAFAGSWLVAGLARRITGHGLADLARKQGLLK